jgi:hypothetical protein
MTSIFSQSEGQNFCSEFESDHYFPLDIHKKKLTWYDLSYFESKTSVKILNGKEYTSFAQEWNSGETDYLYLREENGIIYQYEKCCDIETIRYDPKLKINESWFTADKKTKYTITTKNATLRTPYCNYRNLMVIKAEMSNVTFKFYYKKGYGYIGATDNDNNLISFASPDWTKN